MPTEASNLTIGLLALQGGFALHQKVLQQKVKTVAVRTPQDLSLCDGLILPGGESTTMSYLLQKNGLEKALVDFAQEKPLFGTCAGLIVMTKLGLLPIVVQRNAYGRQSASFTTKVTFMEKEIEAVFIRAPQIKQILSPEVQVLARDKQLPTCIQYHHLLGSTFHPELTEDDALHAHFLRICLHKSKSVDF